MADAPETMTSPYLAAEDRYEAMPYRRVGATGLRLPAISLGLWQNFGDDRALATQRAIVRRAFDRGVTHFDLANNYGPPYGAAEANFGRILTSDLRPYRDELIISSKAGYDMWPGPYGDHGSRKYLLASLDQSLRRLGLEYVDIFYSHRVDPETPLEESLRTIAAYRERGQIRHVGLSEVSVEQLDRGRQVVPIAAVQNRYNLAERTHENVIDHCAEQGIVFVPFFPLRGTDTPAVAQIAARHGASPQQVALAWLLARSPVMLPIPGTLSLDHLQQNLAALELDDRLARGGAAPGAVRTQRPEPPRRRALATRAGAPVPAPA